MNENRFRWIVLIASLLLLVSVASAQEWDGVAGEPADNAADTVPTEPLEAFGPITFFTRPAAILGAATRVDFDDAAHFDAVNVRYADVGLLIARDDGGAVHAYDFCHCGNATSSPPMLACTTRGPGSKCIGCAIHLMFDDDVHTVGFVVGNDGGRFQMWTVEVFDASDAMIGRLTFGANHNVDADEFVGVTSLVPFRRLRLSQNYRWYAVCIDDVTFSTRTIVGP